jgi:hypothetical protein
MYYRHYLNCRERERRKEQQDVIGRPGMDGEGMLDQLLRGDEKRRDGTQRKVQVFLCTAPALYSLLAAPCNSSSSSL